MLSFKDCVSIASPFEQLKMMYYSRMNSGNVGYTLDNLRRNGLMLEYVCEKTEEMSLIAVKQNGLALEHVRKQTEEICIEAVKQNNDSLEMIRDSDMKEFVRRYIHEIRFLKTKPAKK